MAATNEVITSLSACVQTTSNFTGEYFAHGLVEAFPPLEWCGDC